MRPGLVLMMVVLALTGWNPVAAQQKAADAGTLPVRKARNWHEPSYPAIEPVAGDDLYRCPSAASGNAANYLSAYRAFEKKYRSLAADLAAPDYHRAEPADVPELDMPDGNGVPGEVTVLVAVSKDGKPVDQLVECTSDSVFNESALAAVNRTVFVAAKARGSSVKGLARVRYSFGGPLDLFSPPEPPRAPPPPRQ